ncbi:MAG TPA: prepilin peptidase [candidate division Zixibacteria bacterium]|nr:prepilin peptidase [candidate division Zixibacteria bacterium]
MNAYWITLSAVLGLMIGSFMNAVIYRLPRKITLGLSRSRCPHCDQQINAWDNIPLASFLILRGRCRACRGPIHWRYPLVEALNAGLYVWLYFLLGPTWQWAMTCALGSALLAIIFIDIEHYIIPDAITLPGLVIGLAYSLTPEGIGVTSALLGALAGGGGLYLVAALGDLLFKKESMGGGDIKMAAMLGAFVGWQKILVVFIGSALLGTVVSALILPFSKSFRTTRMLPFGPFLALAGLIAALYGDQLIGAYLALALGR